MVYFRTLDDYHRLREQTAGGGTAVVIGGGFIGSEIAAALASTGTKVTLVFPGQAIGARLFPAGLASFLNDYYRDHGVEVLPGEKVEAVAKNNGGFTVTTDSGRTLDADVVVAGLGIVPDTGSPEAAGLGSTTASSSTTAGASAAATTFAAGDVARFPTTLLEPASGWSTRTTPEPRQAGRREQRRAPTSRTPHLPFFYSDLFDLGYEGGRRVGSRLKTVEAWADPAARGSSPTSTTGAAPRGFLLWDVLGQGRRRDRADQAVAGRPGAAGSSGEP